jgi:hypothetical protein
VELADQVAEDDRARSMKDASREKAARVSASGLLDPTVWPVEPF